MRAQDAQAWKKYSFRDDGFEVEFPGAPKITPTAVTEAAKAKIVRTTDYAYDRGSFGFLVAASQAVGTPNFENGSDASFRTWKCAAVVTDRTLQVADVRGRELIGSNCFNGTMRVESRFFVKGSWFYQVISWYQEGGGDAAAAQRFLLSFRIY